MSSRPGVGQKPRFTPYEPSFTAPCPCGSGKKFNECCRSRLPGSGKIDKLWRVAAGEGRWPAALLLIRADIAQYVIWHRRHTVANIRAPGMPLDMYLVDIEALSAHLANLTQALFNTGRLAQAPAVLERLRPVIADPRWVKKIAYHRAMVALVQDDRGKAKDELKALGPITAASTDVELLQIHVDLNGEDLGLTERHALYGRIVEISTSRADKIQYRGAAAFDLLLLGDELAGLAGFEALVADARAMEAVKPLSPRAEEWFCYGLETLAVLSQTPALFDELVVRLESLLATDNWTSAGRARLNRALGDAYRFGRQYAKGIEAYGFSFAEQPTQIVRVFKAECLLRLDQVTEALELIRDVDASTMSEAEAADHAFTYFYIALAAKDRTALVEAETRLRAVPTPHPYFQAQRLQHIVSVHDALAALSAQREPAKVGPFLSALKAVSRYIQLQPNFNGLGINFNNMIDDTVERAERRASERKTQLL